tara:strand:- start:2840 stop:3439 length:600 start_codon:yes stop_codon:yes gene_type:complete
MQDRIADELKRTDLSTQIQRAIQDAIRHFKDEGFSEAESYHVETLVLQQADYALPADFSSAVQWLIAYDDTVQPMSVETIQTINAWDTDRTTPKDGRPLYVALWGTNFRVWPTPQASTYEVRIYYISNIAPPTAPTDAGFWMNEGERLIRTYAKGLIYADVLKQYDRFAEEEKMAGTEHSRLISRTESRHFNADVVPWS